MKKLLLLAALTCGAGLGQLQVISDVLTTPQGGTFGGTITVTLNNPQNAGPLYYSSTTLTGWQQTYTVTSGVVSISLYANSTITPSGTSYTARYVPTAGSAYSETWVVPVGATTIRELRSTTVPTPSVLFSLAQIRQGGATLGQGLVWNGSAWAPSAVVADPMTTTGDIITRSGGVPTRLGIGSAGQVLTVAGGLPSWAAPATSGTVTSVSVATANGVSGTVATATTTPAITLALGAITPTSVAASGAVTGSNLSGTNTGDQTSVSGNAGTATALAANGANCAAGTFPLGVDASGASETCTALPTTIAGTANQITASASTGAVVLSLPAAVSGLTSVAATTFTGALTGNASTATALAANPSDCTAGQFATTIAASGNLTCSVVALADVSGAIGGASAVAAGQVLYGVSAGVAGSEAAFAYSGAGTNSKGQSITASTLAKFTTISGTRSLEISSYGADSNYVFALGGTLNIGTVQSVVTRFYTNNFERGQFSAGGNLLLGTTTDGNFRFDVASSGSSGTARFYDQTATTGSTSLVVRAGAGQSGNLTTWQDSAGATLGYFSGTGVLGLSVNLWHGDSAGVNRIYFTGSGTTYLKGPAATNTVVFRNGSDAGMVAWDSTAAMRLPSASVFGWASTTNAESGVFDTTVSRFGAGVTQFGTTAANADGYVLAAGYRMALTTPASASATGVQGTIAWDADFIYIATGTNAWKRVAIATW